MVAKLFDLHLHSVVIAELLLGARLMGILIALLFSLLACSLENLNMTIKTFVSLNGGIKACRRTVRRLTLTLP